ncbi:BatD family protein, partial [Thermodesulfobacteriota bacterium]
LLIFVISTFLILSLRTISFAELSISAIVDKNITTMDDTIYLSVTVDGLRSSDTIPQVSGGNGFSVTYAGSSSKYSMLNGSVSSNVDFNYRLEPKRVGWFRLPSISFKHKGKILRTSPMNLEVRAGSIKTKRGDIFVTAEVSDAKPYVNEQVVFSFKFYTSTQVSNPSYESPKFSNFISQEMGAVKRYQKYIDGKNYTVNEIKYVLFPLKSGRYNISPVKVTVDVPINTGRRNRQFMGMFSEYKTKKFRTEVITMDVRPLPDYTIKDVPFSNLIGDFRVSTSVGNRELKVNDSTTLTISISGLGNISDATLPSDMEYEGFKTYEDKPAEDIKKTKDGIYGTKTFKKAFIPLKEGRLTIPPIRFSYFDAKKEDYVILATPEYVFNVSPSLEKESLNLVEMAGDPSSKEMVKILGRGIMPLKSSLDSLDIEESSPSPVIIVLVTLSPMSLYFIFVMQMKRREKHFSDEGRLRRKTASKHFSRSLVELNKLLKSGDSTYYNELLNSFKNYIGNRFNMVGSALTVSEIKRVLESIALSQDDIISIKDALKKLDMVQFASANLSDQEKAAVYKVLTDGVKKIEKRAR